MQLLTLLLPVHLCPPSLSLSLSSSLLLSSISTPLPLSLPLSSILVSSVVKEAVSMKRYNLISELSREHFSQSSIYSLRTPPGSTPGSPARAGGLVSRLSQPTSPLLGNGVEGSPCSSGPCSPLAEEGEGEGEGEGEDSRLEGAEVAETVVGDGESPAAAEQAPSPAVASPVSMETAAVETPSTTKVEEVAASVVADVVASVSKETAEAPPSPVTIETAVEQGQAAVEESGKANTMATQTSFDIPGVPASVSSPAAEPAAPETQASSQPACEPHQEAAVHSGPPSQTEAPAGSPVPESPAPAEACVGPPAAEEPVAEAEESGQGVSQETVATEMSVDATEESAMPANDPSLTSDPTLEVTVPAEAELEQSSTGAKPVPESCEVEECVVVECVDEHTAAGVEASVDEAAVKPAQAAPEAETELGVDDGEAAVDPSDSEEAQTEAAEAHEDVEESVDAESVAPPGADPESAEAHEDVEESVDAESVAPPGADPESAEAHEDVEESVDAESVAPPVADPESAEAEQCVGPKETSVEGKEPEQGTDQPAAAEEPAAQSNSQGPASPKASGEASSAGESPCVSPLDCVKEIRDLIVEVIEVEEPVQHYPQSPKE